MTLDAYSDPGCRNLVIPVGETAEMTALAGRRSGDDVQPRRPRRGRAPHVLRWMVLRGKAEVAQTDCVPVPLE